MFKKDLVSYTQLLEMGAQILTEMKAASTYHQLDFSLLEECQVDAVTINVLNDNRELIAGFSLEKRKREIRNIFK